MPFLLQMRHIFEAHVTHIVRKMNTKYYRNLVIHFDFFRLTIDVSLNVIYLFRLLLIPLKKDLLGIKIIANLSQ